MTLGANLHLSWLQSILRLWRLNHRRANVHCFLLACCQGTLYAPYKLFLLTIYTCVLILLIMWVQTTHITQFHYSSHDVVVYALSLDTTLPLVPCVRGHPHLYFRSWLRYFDSLLLRKKVTLGSTYWNLRNPAVQQYCYGDRLCPRRHITSI